MINMYDKDNKKEEVVANVIAIALIFAVIQIVGMIVCMMIFENNLFISIIIMFVFNFVMYKLILD